MSAAAADTVRPASVADVAAIARVQARAYHASYAELLDAAVLRELDGDATGGGLAAGGGRTAVPPAPGAGGDRH